MGEAEKLFPLLRASGCVWHQEPRCALWGERESAQREGKPDCFGFPKGLGRAEYFSKTQSSHGENNCSFFNHYKILRSGLELAGYCSFFALLSATSVFAWSKAFGNSNLPINLTELWARPSEQRADVHAASMGNRFFWFCFM